MGSWTKMCLVVLLMTTLLEAQEVWKSKPVQEWSEEEVQRFLRDSPWVRQVTVEPALLEWQPPELVAEAREGGRESRTKPGRTEASAPLTTRRWQAGTTYHIEWSSAKIVREAGLHFGALTRGAEEENLEPPPLELYVLTVGGADLSAFDVMTEAQLAASTYLRVGREKRRLRPVGVRLRKGENGHTVSVEFAFPREVESRATISAEAETVRFVCKAKEFTLRTRFDLTRMAVAGERDL